MEADHYYNNTYNDDFDLINYNVIEFESDSISSIKVESDHENKSNSYIYMKLRFHPQFSQLQIEIDEEFSFKSTNICKNYYNDESVYKNQLFSQITVRILGRINSETESNIKKYF